MGLDLADVWHAEVVVFGFCLDLKFRRAQIAAKLPVATDSIFNFLSAHTCRSEILFNIELKDDIWAAVVTRKVWGTSWADALNRVELGRFLDFKKFKFRFLDLALPGFLAFPWAAHS